MAKDQSRPDPYANDNLRFRKAFIRERLTELKVEREALIAEREKIDGELSIGKKNGHEAAQQTM